MLFAARAAEDQKKNQKKKSQVCINLYANRDVHPTRRYGSPSPEEYGGEMRVSADFSPSRALMT